MKQKILFLTLALLFAIPSFAQKKHDGKSKEQRRKEMLEFKLQFLASEIDLQQDQKKEFNEVYTQMEQERRGAFKKMKHAEKSIRENPNASEAEYEKASEEIAAAKAEMLRIEQKYDEKLSTFLSKKQMYKLKEAELKFTETARKMRDDKKKQ